MTKPIERLEKEANAAQEKLDKIQRELKAAKQKERAKQKTQARKDQDARKYILGGYMLEQIRNADMSQAVTLQSLYDHMLSTLTRPNDRRVFDLPPLPTEAMNDETLSDKSA